MLKMALILDESGDSAWGITDCCATVDPNVLSKIPTNMIKRLGNA
jgi:hypothetical protein